VEIKGKIVDQAGQPVAGAKVTFFLPQANSGFFVTTSPTGEFTAKGIKPGDWKMQVEAQSFTILQQSVQVAAKDNPPITATLARDDTAEVLAKAEALFKEGRNTEARAEYVALLAKHPELTALNRAIAYTYGREKNHAEALKYLDLALAAEPKDLVLLQLASASAMELNDYPRTLAYLARIDDATLPAPDPLVNAAMNFLNRRRPEEAAPLLDRAIKRFPDSPDAYYYRALASLARDQQASAKTDLEKYLSLAPATAPLVTSAKELLAKIK
jgi:tetratricopeptide (TPR) repeat protein